MKVNWKSGTAPSNNYNYQTYISLINLSTAVERALHSDTAVPLLLSKKLKVREICVRYRSQGCCLFCIFCLFVVFFFGGQLSFCGANGAPILDFW